MTKWNDLFVQKTVDNGAVPPDAERTEREDKILDKVTEAEFYAEDEIANHANSLIVLAREDGAEDVRGKVLFIRGMIHMAEQLGIRITETPYEFDKDGRPISPRATTYQFGVSIPEDDEDLGESEDVEVVVTLLPETGEAHYYEVLDAGSSVDTLDEGFVPMAHAPELVRSCLEHGLDILTERAADAGVWYTVEMAERHRLEIKLATERMTGALASLRVGNVR